MTNNNLINAVAKDFKAECQDDYVGLWSLVRRFRDREKDQSRVFQTTLALLKQLLEGGEIEAGTFNGTNFERFEMPAAEVIEMIRRKWAELGRDPKIGEVAWFTSAK